MGNVIDLKLAASGDVDNLDAPQITFDIFWKAYPRRVAKRDAEKAWGKVRPADYQLILDAIGRAKQTEGWRKDGGAYIPYPATWLNGERWLDELEVDLGDQTMGQCCWNQHGTREHGKPRCPERATKEKHGVVYCSNHFSQVN